MKIPKKAKVKNKGNKAKVKFDKILKERGHWIKQVLKDNGLLK